MNCFGATIQLFSTATKRYFEKEKKLSVEITVSDLIIFERHEFSSFRKVSLNVIESLKNFV